MGGVTDISSPTHSLPARSTSWRRVLKGPWARPGRGEGQWEWPGEEKEEEGEALAAEWSVEAWRGAGSARLQRGLQKSLLGPRCSSRLALFRRWAERRQHNNNNNNNDPFTVSLKGGAY